MKKYLYGILLLGLSLPLLGQDQESAVKRLDAIVKEQTGTVVHNLTEKQAMMVLQKLASVLGAEYDPLPGQLAPFAKVTLPHTYLRLLWHRYKAEKALEHQKISMDDVIANWKRGQLRKQVAAISQYGEIMGKLSKIQKDVEAFDKTASRVRARRKINLYIQELKGLFEDKSYLNRIDKFEQLIINADTMYDKVYLLGVLIGQLKHRFEETYLSKAKPMLRELYIYARKADKKQQMEEKERKQIAIVPVLNENY